MPRVLEMRDVYKIVDWGKTEAKITLDSIFYSVIANIK
jgi:hypothetical protein